MKFLKAFIFVLVTACMHESHGRADPTNVTVTKQQPSTPDLVNHTQQKWMSRAMGNNTKCGIPSLSSVSYPVRIVGGRAAFKHELPWQISLQIRNTHHCGGAIIDDSWVVTAVHCLTVIHLFQLENLTYVVAGKHNLLFEGKEQRRKVKRMIAHPHYNSGTNENDIALLELTEPLSLDGTTASPICLPAYIGNIKGSCMVSGWGHTKENGKNSNILRTVLVPIISDAQCQHKYDREHSIVTENMICAGSSWGGQDACQGDSGGPLSCLGEDYRFFLAGVVSWGGGCGRPNMPGVYTEVNYFVDWIESVMKNSHMTT